MSKPLEYFLLNLFSLFVRAFIVQFLVNYLLSGFDITVQLSYFQSVILCIVVQFINFTPETFRLLNVSEENTKYIRSNEFMTAVLLSSLASSKDYKEKDSATSQEK